MLAMLDLKKHSLRQNHMSELYELVQLDRWRYYIGSIFDVIKFLVLNELPLRVSSEDVDLDNWTLDMPTERF